MMILEIATEELRPDPEQPRKVFDRDGMAELKASLLRWGQLMPVRVRRDGDGHVIVDGERRWRTISLLRTEYPDDDRFRTVKAFEGTEEDQDPRSRKAIQLLTNATGRDLTPGEKALVIKELQGTEDGRSLSDKALQEEFGITKGQLRYLGMLAKAPDFIQAFGMPQKYEVPVFKDGAPVLIDGKGKKESQERPALGLSLLVELVTLFNKLQAYDADRFRETNGQHSPVARREVERIGATAQRDGWSKAQIAKRCDATYTRLTAGKKKAPVSSGLPAVADRLRKQVQQLDLATIDAEEINGFVSAMKALLEEMEQTVRQPLSAA